MCLAGKFGETRRGKVEAPQTTHRQGMRASFQYAVAPAGIADLGQKSLQVHRFRRSVGRRIIAERRVVGNRAEEAGLRARSLDDGVDERSRRGLAAVARPRYELQRLD